VSDAIIRVFQDEPQKHDILEQLWPDLHWVLARQVNDNRRPAPCAISGHTSTTPAVARATLNGTPVCREHLRETDRPGGYPLTLVDPRTWSATP
jgi:hypothetical protein